jgi:hypothetical protein
MIGKVYTQTSSIDSMFSKESLTLQDKKRLFKDIFLCYCINDGFKEDSLVMKDFSMSLYFSLCSDDSMYSFMDSMKLYAESLGVDKIAKGPVKLKGAFIKCFDHYNSYELDRMIDLYFRKP